MGQKLAHVKDLFRVTEFQEGRGKICLQRKGDIEVPNKYFEGETIFVIKYVLRLYKVFITYA